MGYTKDALKGISWLGAFRVFMRSLSYIKIAIIARILMPSQYGASDIALLVLSMVEVLTETGINIFLIQEKEDIDNYINTAWIVSIIRGFIIGIIIFVSAPLIAVFFKSNQVTQLIILVSIVPLLRGFINPSVVKFIKNLDYKKEFYYRSFIFLVETVVTILAVIKLQSAAGIILGLLFSALFEVVLSFLSAKPLPKPIFNKAYFTAIIHRGKWLTAAGIFDYLYKNLDNILVGRILGTSALGLYQRAYSLSMLPMSEISDVFTKTTLPIYVKIADDPKRLKKAFLRTTLIVFLLVLPIGTIFFIFPKEIILIILGSKWLGSVQALRVLAFLGTLRAVLYVSLGLFYSLQKQNIVTKFIFISFAGLAVTILPLIYLWGIVGAGLAAFIGTLLALPFVAYYTFCLFKRKSSYT